MSTELLAHAAEGAGEGWPVSDGWGQTSYAQDQLLVPGHPPPRVQMMLEDPVGFSTSLQIRTLSRDPARRSHGPRRITDSASISNTPTPRKGSGGPAKSRPRAHAPRAPLPIFRVPGEGVTAKRVGSCLTLNLNHVTFECCNIGYII